MPDTPYGFQLHHGTESASVIAALLGELASARPGVRLGATMHLPRQKPSYWSRAAAIWQTPADFLVADPESARMDLPYDERGRGREGLDYLAESDPAANHVRFVQDVLDAQRAAHATSLISPWMVHGLSQTEHELATTIRFALDAQSLVGPGERLLMGLEATEGVFATPEARNAMINELVEGPELPVYLRMRVNPLGGYKPVEDVACLSGLRDVVRSLTDNERSVALPQSGLVGWFMGAFGACSFGAGMSGSMQRNTLRPASRGGRTPLHWYFVPELLGFVQAEEMEELLELDGVSLCPCPYCAGRSPAVGGMFDSIGAGFHFLWWCLTLAGELNAADPEAAVRQRVENAATVAAEIDEARLVLDERSAPTHIPAWQTVLAG
jgi:hypothetical protein